MEENTIAKLEAHSEQGDNYACSEAYDKALHEYWQAFDLLPSPPTQWEVATWILTAIGDANFYLKDYEAGRDNLSNCMHCPGAIGNPFIHLRLGQCQFELGNKDRAADEFTRAYALEGEVIFADEDPKYFALLKTNIEIEEVPQLDDNDKDLIEIGRES